MLDNQKQPPVVCLALAMLMPAVHVFAGQNWCFASDLSNETSLRAQPLIITSLHHCTMSLAQTLKHVQ